MARFKRSISRHSATIASFVANRFSKKLSYREVASMSRILNTALERSPNERDKQWQVSPLGLDVAQRRAAIDEKRLRRDRLARLRGELSKRDLAGALLADPMNIRYATGSRNMAIWTMHAPGRYVFVATDGPVVLFEFGGTFHLSEDLET